MTVEGRQPISVVLTYKQPVTRRRQVGSLPRDYFDQNAQAEQPRVPCERGACQNHPREVWRQVPLTDEQGQPVMQEVTRHFEARPASPVLHALGWGIAAGLAGAAVGGLLGAALGNPALGAIAIGTSAALAAGAVGARKAAADRIKLVWEEHQVAMPRMEAYQETVSPGRLNGRDGYFHRFHPEVSETVLTTYQVPKIVHYRETP